MKIRTIIILTFVVVGLIGAFYGTTHLYISSVSAIEDNSLGYIEAISESRKNHIKTYLEQNIERLKLINSKTWLRNYLEMYNEKPSEDLKEEMAKILKDAEESVVGFERICIASLDGKIIVSTKNSFLGRDVSGVDFFVSGKSDYGVYFLKEEGVNKIFVSGPLIKDNKLLGVGVAVGALDVLEGIVRDRVGLGETGEFWVAVTGEDEVGEIDFLFERLFEGEALIGEENEGIAGPMKRALVGERGVYKKILDYRGEEVVAVSDFLEIGGLGLVTKADRDEVLGKATGKVFGVAVIVVILVMLLVLVSSFFVSGIIIKPFLKIQRAIEIIEGGDLDYKIDIKTKNEAGDIAQAFNKMTDSLKESRLGVDKKVKKQTREIVKNQKSLEDQQAAILNILEDIAEEKDIISSERDKMDTILQSIGDGVFVVNSQYKIILFNKVASDITGFSIKEVLGKNYKNVLKFIFEKDGSLNDEFIVDAIKKGETQEMKNHTLLVKKDGDKIPVADSSAPIKDKQGNVLGCVVVFRDVTEERKVEKMKSEFVSIASHQLRTPLTGIQWVSERLLKIKGKLSGKEKDYVNDIHISSARLARLVDDLLNVSRIESGKIAIKPEKIDVFEFVESYIGELDPLATKKNIKLVLNKNGEKIEALTDKNALQNIVQSIVSNAMEYTPSGGKVGVSLKKQKNMFLVEVSDTGIGIPKKDQDTIFQKFTRGENAQAVKTDGTGLGLYITQQTVELLGGTIKFVSTEGKGTTFFVELPLKSKPKEGDKGFA